MEVIAYETIQANQADKPQYTKNICRRDTPSSDAATDSSFRLGCQLGGSHP